MLQPPDQFQRRVAVKLPFSDRYLSNDEQAKQVRQEIKKQFVNPLVKVVITPDKPPK